MSTNLIFAPVLVIADAGGIAVLENRKVQAYKCPPTFKEMAKLIKSIKKNTHLCILERVHAFPTDGRSSAFKFGTNYGAWMGILESNNVNYELYWNSFPFFLKFNSE